MCKVRMLVSRHAFPSAAHGFEVYAFLDSANMVGNMDIA
jgi:hypothetical protein